MERRCAGLKFLTALVVSVICFSAGDTNAEAAACRLAVLGDSLTAGYGVDPDDGFPQQLARALEGEQLSCEVIDAGVSGDTSAGGAARLGWVLSDKPTHLLVELGGNDALRALPTAQLEHNLERIILEARAAGVEVMLAGMLAPPNLGSTYGDEFAAVFPRLAERHDLPLYPFFLDGVASRPDLLIEDALHPNAEGIAVITERITPAVASWIRGTGTPIKLSKI